MMSDSGHHAKGHVAPPSRARLDNSLKSFGMLKEFLLVHRVEAIDMCLTEYDEKTFVNGIKEEGQNDI